MNETTLYPGLKNKSVYPIRDCDTGNRPDRIVAWSVELDEPVGDAADMKEFRAEAKRAGWTIRKTK